MRNLFTQRLIDRLSTHHQQRNIFPRWYYRFMVRRSFYHTVTSTISFDNHSISSAFHKQFIRLLGVKPCEFILTDGGFSNSDAFMLLPGCTDHFKEGRSFGSEY